MVSQASVIVRSGLAQILRMLYSQIRRGGGMRQAQLQRVEKVF